ncbi:MAG: hypothetical protein II107_10955, partial [Prevotella sp.]|nr:hypothetical protein [Prevotella sp.]
IIADDKISGLKRFKDDVKDVAEGYECGISYVYLPNQPFCHTYRHGCIAGYYHLMPTASSMQALII